YSSHLSQIETPHEMGDSQIKKRRTLVNVLFFGTPTIAVPYLEWLFDHHKVVGVVCQPDQPVGRGYKIHSPPVKEFAIEKGLPVFQPQGRWEESTINQLKKTGADVGVAVAY